MWGLSVYESECESESDNRYVCKYCYIKSVHCIGSVQTLSMVLTLGSLNPMKTLCNYSINSNHSLLKSKLFFLRFQNTEFQPLKICLLFFSPVSKWHDSHPAWNCQKTSPLWELKKKQQYAQIALGFLYLGELHVEVCNLDMQPTGSIYMQLICICIKCLYKKSGGCSYSVVYVKVRLRRSRSSMGVQSQLFMLTTLWINHDGFF